MEVHVTKTYILFCMGLTFGLAATECLNKPNTRILGDSVFTISEMLLSDHFITRS